MAEFFAFIPVTEASEIASRFCMVWHQHATCFMLHDSDMDQLKHMQVVPVSQVCVMCADASNIAMQGKTSAVHL